MSTEGDAVAIGRGAAAALTPMFGMEVEDAAEGGVLEVERLVNGDDDSRPFKIRPAKMLLPGPNMSPTASFPFSRAVVVLFSTVWTLQVSTGVTRRRLRLGS